MKTYTLFMWPLKTRMPAQIRKLSLDFVKGIVFAAIPNLFSTAREQLR